MDNGAEFSPNRKYRYALWRIWDNSKPIVMYIGINPSKADEFANDNTITKLQKITVNNGYGGFYMMNLFAIVSSKTSILRQDPDPVGENDGWIEKILSRCHKVVFAWGNLKFKQAVDRASEIEEMIKSPFCLYINKNGSPKHPLYCLDKTEFIEYFKNKS